MVNDQATSVSESTEFGRRRKRLSKGGIEARIANAPKVDGSGTAVAVAVNEPLTDATEK